jgi:hypothetical protein
MELRVNVVLTSNIMEGVCTLCTNFCRSLGLCMYIWALYLDPEATKDFKAKTR